MAACSDEKVQQCLKHGATWGFNYKTEDWAGNVKLAAKPAGVHIVLDCVGCASAVMRASLTLCRPPAQMPACRPEAPSPLVLCDYDAQPWCVLACHNCGTQAS